MSRSYPHSFVRDNMTVVFGHALLYMKGIIIMPLIIKTVGVTVYGGFVLLSSVLGVVFGLSSMGAGFRAKRFMPAAEGMTARREIFYPQFYFQLFSVILFSCLLILLNPTMNRYIFKSQLAYSAWVIPFYLLFYFLYSQGSDYFRYTSRINFMTAASICFPYMHIAMLLLFLYFAKTISLNVLLLSEALSALLVSIPCFWTIFREIGATYSFYSKKGLLKDIKIGFPLIFSFLVDFILSGSDRYFIAFYLTVSAVGYYNPAYVLGSVMILVAKAMCTVLPQLMSKAVDGNSDYEARRMLNYAIKMFLLMALPFIFGSLVLSRPVLSLLTSSEIAENAFLVTPIVALGTVFCGLSFLLSNALFVQIKTAAMFKMNLYAAAFNFIANLIFLYYFRDIVVAAITTCLGYLIGFLYAYRSVHKDWQIDFQVPALSKSLVASIVMAAVLYLISYGLRDVGVSIALVCELALGISTYMAVLLILKTFSPKELSFIRSLVYR